jgi:hypothetical protein
MLAGVVFAQGHKKKSSAGHVTASIPASITAAAKAAAATGCDASLWQHVYHKARLHVVEKCIEVTGTIHHTKPEAEGDDHTQLALDSPFVGLLNDRNKSAQANSLVIEPVCQGPVTQPDAVTACRDFHSPVSIPAHGDKVKVVGSFVFDAESGHGWMEVHPVSSIEVMH